jgi:NAD(P)-dependent dehydrogenase (short-subunit alcohol dehydrogenase family)
VTPSRPLKGQVALVAGATREHLTKAGVYAGRPETIDETAAWVTRRGGVGIPARTDHLVPEQVEALVSRVREERGRLDVVVNDISKGEAHEWKPFWTLSLEKGFRVLRSALHSHRITSRYAAPLMVEGKRGLIVEIGDGDNLDDRGTRFYDLIKIAVSRFAFAMAEELRPHGVAAVAITPGTMRTEAMLDAFGVTEANWRDGARKDPNFLSSETPFFVGRAVAALAAGPRQALRFRGPVPGVVSDGIPLDRLSPERHGEEAMKENR